MASPTRWTLMLTAALAQPAWAQCPGNVIEMADDAVNGADLAQVLSLWGPAAPALKT